MLVHTSWLGVGWCRPGFAVVETLLHFSLILLWGPVGYPELAMFFQQQQRHKSKWKNANLLRTSFGTGSLLLPACSKVQGKSYSPTQIWVWEDATATQTYGKMRNLKQITIYNETSEITDYWNSKINMTWSWLCKLILGNPTLRPSQNDLQKPKSWESDTTKGLSICAFVLLSAI